MTRLVPLLLLAVLATACGAARADTPDFTADLDGLVASTSTVAVAGEAAPSTVELGSSVVQAGYVLPDDSHVHAVVGIERPAGFPSIAELGQLVPAGGQPHARARITSCLAVIDGTELLATQGFDTDQLDQQMTITYFDGLVIWEDPVGFRQIFVPGKGSFYQDDDGAWREAVGFEWTTVGPLADWSMAQIAAAQVIEGRPQVVGYELVADTPTVHLALTRGEDRADLWLDETGAALRIVQDFTGLDGTSRWLGVWSVETLSPVLRGPLPISP